MKIVWRNSKGLGILRSITITQEDIDKIIDIIWNFVMDNYYGMKGIKDSNYQMIMVERVLDRKVKSSQFYKQSDRKMKLFIKDFARENYLYIFYLIQDTLAIDSDKDIGDIRKAKLIGLISISKGVRDLALKDMETPIDGINYWDITLI